MRLEKLQELREGRGDVVASRPRRTVPLLLVGEIREKLEAVEIELERLEQEKAGEDAAKLLAAKGTRPLNTRKSSVDVARIEELKAQSLALRQKAAEHTLYVVVEGLPSTELVALKALHPPRTMENGLTEPADRVLGANDETIRIPLVRSCIIGHRPTGAEGEPVEPLDKGMVDWLLGTPGQPATDEQPEIPATPPFLTARQIADLAVASYAVNYTDDAIPLSRTP